MSSVLPASVPVAYKSRRGWLIAFGVTEILVACFFLLLILLTLIVFRMPSTHKPPPQTPISSAVLMAIAGVQYGIIAGVFLIAGIGSIRCRNWARILMLAVSGFWLVIGVLSTVVLAVFLPTIREQAGVPPPEGLDVVYMSIITLMVIVMVLLPVVFLFFYSRKSVRATCLAQAARHVLPPLAGAVQTSSPPIPVLILALWSAVAGVGAVAYLVMRVAIVFGVVLHGIAAFSVMLTSSALFAYSAWSIYRQKLIGWKIALFNAGFWMFSMLVTFARHPDPEKLYREMGNSEALQMYQQIPQLSYFVFSMCTLIMIALLVLLVYTRKFFHPEQPQ
ncbi:MAG: hypothetical protein LAO04_18010 [Acidobacteriia bacterium]|nr:hypothetical protein [Terriglobia bacterium]